MYSKYKTEQLVDKYDTIFKNLLGIKSKVRYHVVNSTTKKYKDMKISTADNMGLSLIARDGSADVFLYYDKHNSEREMVSTLFHELVHVRLHKLTGLVTLNFSKAYSEEERIVRDLERLFMEIFWS